MKTDPPASAAMPENPALPDQSPRSDFDVGAHGAPGEGRATGPDHVNALIAGRNEWRGNKLLDELARDFAAAGNPEAASAIREWQRMVAGVKIASQITSLCK
jgi:hypothetical protein